MQWTASTRVWGFTSALPKHFSFDDFNHWVPSSTQALKGVTCMAEPGNRLRAGAQDPLLWHQTVLSHRSRQTARHERHTAFEGVVWTIINCFDSSRNPFIYVCFNLLQQQQSLANLTAKLGIESRPPTLHTLWPFLLISAELCSCQILTDR